MPRLITKITNGKGTRYVVRVATRRADGRYATQTRTVDTRREAERVRDELKRAARDGTSVAPSRITVAGWAEEWLRSITVRVRGRSVADAEQVVRLYVNPTLGRRRLQALTRRDVANWVAALSREGGARGQGLAPRTVAKALAVLHTTLAAAKRRGLVNGNAAKLAREDRPRRVRKERTWLDPQGARRFMREVDPSDAREVALLTLLLTGARPAEVLALRWSDLSEDRLSIQRTLVERGPDAGRLLEPKTPGSRRSVPLPRRLIEALATHRGRQARDRLRAGSAWHDLGLIFTDAIGRPLRQSALRVFKKVLRRAELPDMRVYDLRHSQASLLLAAGVPAKVVAERLGHSSVGLTLDTYSHVAPSLQETAVERLERLLG